MPLIKTLQVRVRDKHTKLLRQMARDVNLVWNYYNELSAKHLNRTGQWLSAYDLQKYSKGSSRYLSIDSTAVQAIAEEFATRRRQFCKAKLQWRRSGGVRRSLGWVPFKAGAARWVSGQVRYAGLYFKVWDSYGLSQYRFRAGSFSEDARGRWYFNVAVEVQPQPDHGKVAIGIDLGLKDIATTSDPALKLEAGRWYRDQQQKLGIAQRARKKHRMRAIHARIRNRRKNDLHQFSRKLVDRSAAIFVGNVSSKQLVKTSMAKSVLDAGWGQLKTMLDYKCAHAGIVFEEVDESYTTQRCSCCGVIPRSSPKGRAALGIREWTCCECGASHNRDLNAARNILALGHERLAGGIPFL
ncbi:MULTISPECIES: transposase [unclassified Microbulbifer]|uniref:RNA-guided endonuclease InsQ/TnpB family protein n=1 Tax=unclassified Microbulbifer TaxID=2619833 RepID=UPI0027E55860|nr:MULTISPECIES: transposase [unclassified Microbulbifer]